uniref:BSD domain-containing protein n=1 Tax=Davidia involucrata TaxID=16924 RepID=A0A5B6ZQH1_DAVIN
MSSWLSISLPNPFKSSQSDDQYPSPTPENTTLSSDDHSPSHAGGVKEDLSVLGQTIGRQLIGVAAFLAPPPPPPPQPPPPHSAPVTDEVSSSQTFLGIKNDLVEIGGSFKSSLSLFSTNKAVTEISRFASNLLQFNEGDEVEGDEDEEASEVVGVTEEVLGFVQEISLRPECWTDFPLSLENDFVLSDTQREHALAVEYLVPSLTALRRKLHSDLSDEQFWMIYFIFLLPRLNEHDSKLLSTPEIVDVRKILLQKLQNKRNLPVETSEDSEIVNSSQEGDRDQVNYTQGDNNPSHGKQVSDEAVTSHGKQVLGEAVKTALGMENDGHENTEQWLDEEDVDTCTSVDAQKQPENEEDVSFSDLDDDDNDLSGRLSGFRLAKDNRVSSPNGSNEWVQLNENSGTQGGQQKAGQLASREKDSEGEESNEWLTVDDIDLDSLVTA